MNRILICIPILGAFCFLIFATSCTYDPLEETTPPPIDTTSACDTIASTFMAKVIPILSTNCNLSGCHNTSSSAAGYAFETYAQVLVGINDGSLLCSINHESGCSNMPKFASKLADSDIQIIQCWVNKGANDN